MSVPVSVKIVVTGGVGVGKTTTVAALSEYSPMRSFATIDDGETSRSVELDCGRVSLGDSVILYTFGALGCDGLDAMVADLAEGALGGLVVLDPLRLTDAKTALRWFGASGLPHVVAVNYFDAVPMCDQPTAQDIRDQLALDPSVPIMRMDPRLRSEVKAAALVLLNVIMQRVAAGSLPLPRVGERTAERV